jgi:hypothetical protein
MIKVCIQHRFAFPVEEVFPAVVDLTRLPQIPGLLQTTRVIAAPGAEPDGIGAQREIDLGLVWFREEIVGFEHLRQLDYLIREARPHFEHVEGRFAFASVPGGTLVTWSSSIRLPLPLADGVLAGFYRGMIAGAFRSGLLLMELQLKLARRRAAAGA